MLLQLSFLVCFALTVPAAFGQGQSINGSNSAGGPGRPMRVIEAIYESVKTGRPVKL